MENEAGLLLKREISVFRFSRCLRIEVFFEEVCRLKILTEFLKSTVKFLPPAKKEELELNRTFYEDKFKVLANLLQNFHRLSLNFHSN
jgi:hypothetical protein